MAVGGFTGNDPVLSLDAFAAMAGRGEVRYVLLANQGRGSISDFARWVREHGQPIDDTLWRSLPREPRRQIMLYELKMN